MKKNSSTLVLLLMVFGAILTLVAADGDVVLRSAAKVEGFKDLFQSGDYYIAGQPTLEALRWLKAQGVALVVNIRSESENKDFTALAFNEENLVKELGMAYLSLPVGEKESYGPKTVDKLAEALKPLKGKALLHCEAAGRATNLWMAYLVRCRGFSLNEAVAVGKQLKFTFRLEDFLGLPLSITFKEP